MDIINTCNIINFLGINNVLERTIYCIGGSIRVSDIIIHTNASRASQLTFYGNCCTAHTQTTTNIVCGFPIIWFIYTILLLCCGALHEFNVFTLSTKLHIIVMPYIVDITNLSCQGPYLYPKLYGRPPIKFKIYVKDFVKVKLIITSNITLLV